MMVIWIILIILNILLVLISLKYILLKRDIRQLSQNLSNLSPADTNIQMTTTTFDKGIVELIVSINSLLEKSRAIHRKSLASELEIKQAITNISHDLRTPLTSAKGYLQIMQGDIDNSTRERYLAVILERLEVLSLLLDTLFMYSNATEEIMDVQEINVSNIISDTILGFYAELTKQKFLVNINMPDIPVYCFCDEDALRRIIQNILKNVLIHGKDFVELNIVDNTIEIRNYAEGLEYVDFSNVFNRFYTSDTSRTAKQSGLGLAIAKKFTEKMGGRIYASKEGNVFCVQIVLATEKL